MPLPPQFPLPLVLQRTAPRMGVLAAPFAFISKTELGRIEIPAGFDTDYASVPRLFWNIYPPDGAYTEAALIHDYLYWEQPPGLTRAQADAIFLEGMIALGVGWLCRTIIHRAVRLGGWAAWNRNAKFRAGQKPRPADTQTIAT